ncbi:MAG: hypothetical protein LBU81_03935 [Methanosarcinales archaeon]|jgi:hypothetical protein|nr:hypothetical protein [Methanosarcinales archaeon]
MTKTKAWIFFLILSLFICWFICDGFENANASAAPSIYKLAESDNDDVLNGAFTYSYVINTEISTMRANMTGYQSNADYISSDYGVYYES